MKKILDLLAVVVVAAFLSVGCLSDDPYTVALPDIVSVESGDPPTVEPPYESTTIDPPKIIEIPPIMPIDTTLPPTPDPTPDVQDDPAKEVVIPPIKPPSPVYPDNYWVPIDLDELTPIVIPPSPVVPPSVIPDKIKETFEKDMPIFSGVTPPDISGQYLANNRKLVASSLSNDWVGMGFVDEYVAFIKGSNGKIAYKSKEVGYSQSEADDVFVDVVGKDKDFTTYFVGTGVAYGIYVKQSILISGTMTSEGIRDYRYAFIMLEKGPDPNNRLVPVNSYRIIKDSDGLAARNNWLSKKAQRPDSDAIPVMIKQGLLSIEATGQ
jgi:hypothetical protein